MRRDWKPARAKVDAERGCRVCRGGHRVEAAHIIPRSRVAPPHGDDPRNIVPLCSSPFPAGHDCHGRYDAGGLDLRPFLTADEVAYATELVGEAEALRRIMGSRAWRLSSRLAGSPEGPLKWTGAEVLRTGRPVTEHEEET